MKERLKEQQYMELTNLAIKTNFIEYTETTNIINHGSFIQICTKHRPDFIWGNYLIFPSAPQTVDYARWIDTFNHAFSSQKLQHYAFSWDRQTKPNADAFITAGFKLCEMTHFSDG